MKLFTEKELFAVWVYIIVEVHQVGMSKERILNLNGGNVGNMLTAEDVDSASLQILQRLQESSVRARM